MYSLAGDLWWLVASLGLHHLFVVHRVVHGLQGRRSLHRFLDCVGSFVSIILDLDANAVDNQVPVY